MDILNHMEEQTDLLFEMIKQVKNFASAGELFGDVDPAYALQQRNEAAYKYNAALAKLQNLPIQEVVVIGDVKGINPMQENCVTIAEQYSKDFDFHPHENLN